MAKLVPGVSVDKIAKIGWEITLPNVQQTEVNSVEADASILNGIWWLKILSYYQMRYLDSEF